MIDVKKYNSLKEINKKYGYGSWTRWKDNDPKNKDVSFFDEEEKNGTLFNRLTDKVIMLALNPSGEDNGTKPLLWENFRGGRYDQRISMLVNKKGWQGCYITDLFKEKIGSSSNDAEEKIRKWEKEEILEEKIEPFVKELNVIGLDSLDRIIVFGNQTFKWLEKIVKKDFLPQEVLDKAISIKHYSYNWKKCRSDDGYRSEVIDQI
jgi:hypothetical protein